MASQYPYPPARTYLGRRSDDSDKDDSAPDDSGLESGPIMEKGTTRRKPAPRKKRRSRCCIVAIAIIVILVLLGLTLGLYFGLRDKGGSSGFNATPLQPPSFPLAVRSPYLHSWLPGAAACSLAATKAQFWKGQELGWSVAARVNGKAYSLFGNPGIGEQAKVTKAEYTATHTYFSVSAGDANFMLDFFSPVSPKNYLRQSLPFSYLTVSVDGSMDVQIYSDIDSQWTGSNDSASWSSDTVNGTTRFEIARDNQEEFSETHNMAIWGQVVYATQENSTSNLTIQTGDASSVRNTFATRGNLTGATTADWTHDGVVAFAHNLGTPNKNTQVTFAIGHVRERNTQYLGEVRTPYYRSQYLATADALNHFFDDYPSALAESLQIDENTRNAGNDVSSKYGDIITLSLRQAYGAIELTTPWENPTNTSDTLAFIKEISSNGNMNTIDVILSAHPVYLATNPEIMRLLLEPVFRYQKSGKWPKPWVIHDMGKHYPNATGHDNGKAEQMPVDVSASMPLMMLAYQQFTNKTDFSEMYQGNCTDAVRYLTRNAWYPENQFSTTDAAGKSKNQTVLAIKAAIAMKAFAAMYPDAPEAEEFKSNGTGLAELLYEGKLGTDDSQTTWLQTYNNRSSWMAAYYMYPDKLLNLETFPQAAYDMQSKFLPSKRLEYGVPLDSRLDWTKTDWNSWIAAISSDSTKSEYIDDIYDYMTNGENAVPFADRYHVKGDKNGKYVLTMARPTVGAHFALLAMNRVNILP